MKLGESWYLSGEGSGDGADRPTWGELAYMMYSFWNPRTSFEFAFDSATVE